MYRTVVLAGEREGVSPFAAAFDVEAKVLVPVAGRASLERVVETLRASESSDGGIICGPDAAIVAENATCRQILSIEDFRWLAPGHGPASSALASVDALGGGADSPVFLTTGDHAMLRPETVDAFCRAAAGSEDDFVVGLAPYARVRECFPGSKRTVWRFSDTEVCGCNLFFIRNARGRGVLSFWRSVEGLRKQPWRIAGQLGWMTLIRYFAGRLSSVAAFDTLSRRTGCRVGAVTVDDARAAVDVDSMADWQLAERILGAPDDDTRSQ